MKKYYDISIITLGRILAMLTSIISIRIFTTLLSPSEIGRFNVILAVYGCFGLILLNPVGMYVNRKIIEWHKEKNTIKNLVFLFKYFLIVALFSIVIVTLFRPFLGININYNWLIALIAGCIIFTSGNTAYSSYLNLLGQTLWFVVVSILTLWGSLFFSIFLVLQKTRSAEYWLTGQLLGQGVLLIVVLIVLIKFLKPNNTYNNEYSTDFSIPVVYRFAWPLSIGVFLFWIQTQGYRFVYQKIAGTEVLGFFAIGFGIGSSLMISFDALFNQYYQPIFYSEIANSNEQQRTIAWNKYSSSFFPLIIIMVVYIAFGGTVLAKIFTGAKFQQVGNIVLWGAVVEGLRMMTSAMSMVSHSQFEMKPLILPGIAGAVTTIIGILFLVRINPFVGGGLALALGWLVALVYLYNKMKKILQIQIPWKRIFYSLFLSAPLIVFFMLMKKALSSPTVLQSLVLLGISGLYLLFAEFVLARRWLSDLINIPFIERMEQRLNYIYRKIYET